MAANFCAVAVGTETDGSIICPSGMNGIVGLKPTVGLVSRAGHHPDLAQPGHRRTDGPHRARRRPAARGPGRPDQRDPATAAAAGKAMADYTRFLDPGGLRGARIGVARQRLWGYSPAADAAAAAALELMKKAGAEIVDPADLPSAADFDRDELEVLLYELKAGLNAYLESLGKAAPVKAWPRSSTSTIEKKDREMAFFGQELFLAAQEKGAADRKGLPRRARLSAHGRAAAPKGSTR